jgi:hypothetical protein
VTAEVVVVVQDQDFRVRPDGAIEVRGRKPADPAADHNEVIALAGVPDSRPALPEIAVAQGVGVFERAWMAAAQAGQQRRIVVRLVLRPAVVGLCRRGPGTAQACLDRPDGDGHAVEEIAPMDRAVHAQRLVGPVPLVRHVTPKKRPPSDETAPHPSDIGRGSTDESSSDGARTGDARRPELKAFQVVRPGPSRRADHSTLPRFRRSAV